MVIFQGLFLSVRSCDDIRIRHFAPRLKDRSSAAVAKNSYRVSRRANNLPPASLWRDGRRSVVPSSVKCLLFFAERQQGKGGVGGEIQAAKLLMSVLVLEVTHVNLFAS